jgi:hypothetical protein
MTTSSSSTTGGGPRRQTPSRATRRCVRARRRGRLQQTQARRQGEPAQRLAPWRSVREGGALEWTPGSALCAPFLLSPSGRHQQQAAADGQRADHLPGAPRHGGAGDGQLVGLDGEGPRGGRWWCVRPALALSEAALVSGLCGQGLARSGKGNPASPPVEPPAVPCSSHPPALPGRPAHAVERAHAAVGVPAVAAGEGARGRGHAAGRAPAFGASCRARGSPRQTSPSSPAPPSPAPPSPARPAAQPGEYSYVLHYRDQYKLDPDGDTAAADVLGRSRNLNRLTVPPPAAFALYYATGWPRCSLVYRVVPREGTEARRGWRGGGAGAWRGWGRGRGCRRSAGREARGARVVRTPALPHLACPSLAFKPPPTRQPDEWREIAFDGAPSRGGPGGGRWMQALIEAPGPEASLQFYVRGPRPDINDEWGSTSRRGGGGGGGGSRGNGRGGTSARTGLGGLGGASGVGRELRRRPCSKPPTDSVAALCKRAHSPQPSPHALPRARAQAASTAATAAAPRTGPRARAASATATTRCRGPAGGSWSGARSPSSCAPCRGPSCW